MKALIMAVCFLTAVKFLLIAFWMMDQPYRRSARYSLWGAGLCVVAGLVYGFDLALPAAIAGLAALLLGITSIRLMRVGRG